VCGCNGGLELGDVYCGERGAVVGTEFCTWVGEREHEFSATPDRVYL